MINNHIAEYKEEKVECEECRGRGWTQEYDADGEKRSVEDNRTPKQIECSFCNGKGYKVRFV